MIAGPLKQVLEATGYLDDGQPAQGVHLESDARSGRRGREFSPDALWRGPSSLTVYFKYENAPPDAEQVAEWRREIWNEGFAPLLWIVSPQRIDLYNGFGRPQKEGDAEQNRLRTFQTIADELVQLDNFAGRLAMESGQFWVQAHSVDRRTGVDRQLLADLAALEADLVGGELDRAIAQGLIGRAIFTQYLVDRKIVDAARLEKHCGATSLPSALRDPTSAQALFRWLSQAFNGDMFPASATAQDIQQDHFARIADFLEAVDPKTQQQSLFPYQFDVIPVELISSIYEQFAHAKAPSGASEARAMGVHYTRLSVVSLILDEVLDGVSGSESVLDLTCGSGVFLVEAFRRLVMQRSQGTPTRAIVRKTLREQIYGVDISPAAVRVAAFSLYLAALELDPDPQPPEELRFEPLIDRNLFIADARTIDLADKARGVGTRGFDVIVGNPPWTFKGRGGTAARRDLATTGVALQPRGEGFDFVVRAMEFGRPGARYGVVLDALPFFAGSRSGARASLEILRALAPVTLVNLAAHTGWLFGTASKPAVVLLSGHRKAAPGKVTVVNVPWTPAAERSHTFEIAPSDISTVELATLEKEPELLKAAAVGRSTDMLLIHAIKARHRTLDEWLTSVGSRWRDGLIFGDQSKDAPHLEGLELLAKDDLRPFSVRPGLDRLGRIAAERPRDRAIYKAPLLLVKEFLSAGPRPLAAVSMRDLVYTEAFFGAALEPARADTARLLAGLLSSSLAAWFFAMTASEFGIWKRRLFTSDVGRLPTPDPDRALETDAGRRVVAIVKSVESGVDAADTWTALDDAVADLYALDYSARTVIADGLRVAAWQWREGRLKSTAPATAEEQTVYAAAFAGSLQDWLASTGRRSVRAEVFDLPNAAPVRICRFLLESGYGPPRIERFAPGVDLQDTIHAIGNRIGVRLGSALYGGRELRVHGENEVVIIKPAASRYWMASKALEDANAVVVESFTGAAA